MTVADRPVGIAPADPVRTVRRAATPLPFGHRPGLDGMRAVAALLVVMFHAGVPFLNHGYTGVDVFFVLSGFLITSLLIREIAVRHRVDLLFFYARRARRLLPAALLVLVATAVLYQLLATPLDVAENRGGFVAAALYVSNWFFLARSQDYFAEDAAPSPVLHYWSLSVEEQFYIVWPVLLLVLFLITRQFGVTLRVVVAGLALAGLVYAGVLAQSEAMQSYLGTLARAYQLLVGAVVALWVFRRQRRGHAPPPGAPGTFDRPWGQMLAGVGLLMVLVAASPLLGDLTAYGRGVLSALGTGALILGMELAPAGGVPAALSWSPARRLGDYSYPMYLWHWPVIVLGDLAGWLPVAWLPRVTVVLAVTITLAAATWWWVEVPIRRFSLAGRTNRRRAAAAAPVAAAAAAGLLLVLLPVSSTAASLLAATAGEPRPARDATLVESGGSPNPAAPTVLLVGDSHSGFWFEAFAAAAEQQGWRVTSVRRDGCAWPDVDQVPPNGGASPCPDLRERALEVASREQPDLTVLVTRALFDHPLHTDLGDVQPGETAWLDEVRRGTVGFLDQLQQFTPYVVPFEPIPETAESMNRCLSTGASATSCSLPAIDPPGAAMVEAYWRRLAARPGVVTVDLDELVCPGGTCSAMVDAIPTHRDSQHLTGAFAGSLMPAVERQLAEQGVDLARATMTERR